MCSPVFIPLAMTAAGTIMQSNAQVQAGKANAAIAAQNASIAKAQEQSAFDKGAVQETQYSNQVKELQGRAQAVAGNNGIDVNRGSPLDLIVQSTGFGERDIRTIENNAAMEAFGYSAQATNFTNQGLLDISEGQKLGNATLLTGASSLGNQFGNLWDRGSFAGLFGGGGGGYSYSGTPGTPGEVPYA